MPKHIYLGVNRVNYQNDSNKTIYSLCGDQAAFIPCTRYI